MTSGQQLSISVVIPTYRRPDLLERCLQAVRRQHLAPDAYEIIVCDDGPSAATRELVERFGEIGGGLPCIRYLAITSTQGPAGARNRGWEAARAPVVAFTDDDTVPEPAWLEAGLAVMASGAAAATGTLRMPLPPQASDYERDAARLTEAEFITANCFLRRDVLEAVGGFDERFGVAWREDSDLHFTLLERGYLVVKAPDAVVIHPLRPAAFAAGIGMQKKIVYDVLLYAKHPHLYRQRIRRRPPWLYLLISAMLVAAVCGIIAGWPRLAVAALLGWALATLLFFLWRLSRSALSWRNIGELLLTSICIPPLSIFWRLVGVRRFGPRFP